jgi:hypothetical protein
MTLKQLIKLENDAKGGYQSHPYYDTEQGFQTRQCQLRQNEVQVHRSGYTSNEESTVVQENV